MERAQKAQRDAAQGQSGLFGLFDETPARGRNAEDFECRPIGRVSWRTRRRCWDFLCRIHGQIRGEAAEFDWRDFGGRGAGSGASRAALGRSRTWPTKFRWRASCTGCACKRAGAISGLYAQGSLEDAQPADETDLLCAGLLSECRHS